MSISSLCIPIASHYYTSSHNLIKHLIPLSIPSYRAPFNGHFIILGISHLNTYIFPLSGPYCAVHIISPLILPSALYFTLTLLYIFSLQHLILTSALYSTVHVFPMGILSYLAFHSTRYLIPLDILPHLVYLIPLFISFYQAHFIPPYISFCQISYPIRYFIPQSTLYPIVHVIPPGILFY